MGMMGVVSTPLSLESHQKRKNPEQVVQSPANIQNIWESVVAPGVPRDLGEWIHYWVLFVPRDDTPDVWELVRSLTFASCLGNRSAVSPGVMTEGAYANHYTIILDTPKLKKDAVAKQLEENGLKKYRRAWKSRTRFNQSTAMEEIPFQDLNIVNPY